MEVHHDYQEPIGVVRLTPLEGATEIEIPIFPGLLKHPAPVELAGLLADVRTARKYTCIALQRCPWQILKHFPRQWLQTCLSEAGLPPARQRAIEFMLGR